MDNISRTSNSIKNVSYGLIITALNTIVSFITRTFLVKILGTEVLGINGLFTEIIAMMSLAEMGIGMAIVYSLYQPIHEKDEKKISQLMSLYKNAYHFIAIVTLIIGIILTPFIDFFLTDVQFPINYIRIVFMLFVVKTSGTYLFSYKTSLLNADQKQYLVSLISAIVKLIITILTIFILLLFENYILYLCLMIIQTLLTNIILSVYVDNKYPFLDSRDNLSQEEKQIVFANVKNIFIKRTSGVITSSTDNILISKLVSTILVGLYSNYTMIFTIFRTLKQQLTNGVAASIGNLSVTEKPDKCVQVLKRLTFIYYSFAIITAAGLLSVSDTFIEIWLGHEYLLSGFAVSVAILNLFIEICSEPLWQFLEVSGLFSQDKYIGIVGSVVNLIVSIVLGRTIGIVGIFLGTLCTQIIQFVLKTILIYKRKWNLNPVDYLSYCTKIIIGFIMVYIFIYFVVESIVIENLLASFLVKSLISVIFSIFIIFIFNFKSDEYAYVKELICKILNNKWCKKRNKLWKK